MRTRDSLPERKRKTYEALQRSGLMIKEVRERSGVGKESVRNALQGKRVGAQSARTLATVLGEGLSWWTTRLGKRAKTPPSKTF